MVHSIFVYQFATIIIDSNILCISTPSIMFLQPPPFAIFVLNCFLQSPIYLGSHTAQKQRKYTISYSKQHTDKKELTDLIKIS